MQKELEKLKYILIYNFQQNRNRKKVFNLITEVLKNV